MLWKWLSSMFSYVYVPETGVAPTSLGFQGPNLPSERMTPGGSVLVRVARYDIGTPEPTFVTPRRSILRTYGFSLRSCRMNSSTAPSAVIFEIANDFPPGPAFRATRGLPPSSTSGGTIMCMPTTRTAESRLGEPVGRSGERQSASELVRNNPATLP